MYLIKFVILLAHKVSGLSVATYVSSHKCIIYIYKQMYARATHHINVYTYPIYLKVGSVVLKYSSNSFCKMDNNMLNKCILIECKCTFKHSSSVYNVKLKDIK